MNATCTQLDSSRLRHLRRWIEDTHEALRRLEPQLRRSRRYPSLLVMRDSLRNRLAVLERRLAAEARRCEAFR